MNFFNKLLCLIFWHKVPWYIEDDDVANSTIGYSFNCERCFKQLRICAADETSYDVEEVDGPETMEPCD